MQQTEAEKAEELLRSGASEDGQAAIISVNSEEYRNLQSFATKARQGEIDFAVKLANKDKKSILDIADKKLQNKVIKEVYNLEDLEQVKLIHGDTFYKEKDEGGQDDDEETETKLSKIETELKLLKYNSTKSQMESEIENYKKENKTLFIGEDDENKLREELKYISTELPIKERINRASKIAFGINPVDAGYLALKQSGTNGTTTTSFSEKEKTKIEDEFKSIFKIKT